MHTTPLARVAGSNAHVQKVHLCKRRAHAPAARANGATLAHCLHGTNPSSPFPTAAGLHIRKGWGLLLYVFLHLLPIRSTAVYMFSKTLDFSHPELVNIYIQRFPANLCSLLLLPTCNNKKQRTAGTCLVST